MSLKEKETTYEFTPEFNDCICGAKVVYSTSSDCGKYEGTAYVKCPNCGLNMFESSYDIGYSDSIDSISVTLENRWNLTIKKRDKDVN